MGGGAEAAGFVQPREEKAKKGSNYSLQLHKERSQRRQNKTLLGHARRKAERYQSQVVPRKMLITYKKKMFDDKRG